MKIPRRRFLHLAAGTAALLAASRIARAQTYPTRPVRIVVGFPAGSASDIVARLMGQWLSEHLGQPFVIENRPGAGGNIATEAASSWLVQMTQSMRRSTESSASISYATSRRSLASSACPRSWW
jgi:tripartite-type tricarboxylate transporter receptor subunit TctC